MEGFVLLLIHVHAPLRGQALLELYQSAIKVSSRPILMWTLSYMKYILLVIAQNGVMAQILLTVTKGELLHQMAHA